MGDVAGADFGELVGEVDVLGSLPHHVATDLEINDAAVDPATGQPVGSALLRVRLVQPEHQAPQQRLSAPRLGREAVYASAVLLAPSAPAQAPAPCLWPSFYSAAEIAAHEADLAAEAAADLADQQPPQAETPPMLNTEEMIQNAARTLSRKTGLPMTECVNRARQVVSTPISQLVTTTRPSTSAPAAMTPKLPPAGGTVTDVRTARVWLAAAMPGWSTMANDDRQRAAVLLRDVMKGPSAAQLARTTSDPRPAVLLSLFPGATRTAQARAYLAATVQGFAALDYQQQTSQARALNTTHNLIEVTA